MTSTVAFPLIGSSGAERAQPEDRRNGRTVDASTNNEHTEIGDERELKDQLTSAIADDDGFLLHHLARRDDDYWRSFASSPKRDKPPDLPSSVTVTTDADAESESDWDLIDDPADDDWDWTLEIHKPAQTKGIRLSPVRLRDGRLVVITHSRALAWERRAGRWCGRWHWVRERSSADMGFDEAGRQERAIVAWNAEDIPAELFLRIAECLVGGPVPDHADMETYVRDGHGGDAVDAWGARNCGELVGLAMVCRAWRKLLAPLLYSKIVVRGARAEGICAALRGGGSGALRYGRKVTLYAREPWSVSARLARYLPEVGCLLWINSGDSHRAPSYHPRLFRVHAHMQGVFVNVTWLYMGRYHFLSSADLLLLLGSFPALSFIFLRDVTIGDTNAIVTRIHRKPNRIRRISFHGAKTDIKATALSLMDIFTWIRDETRSASLKNAFPGLPDFEVHVVTQILKFLEGFFDRELAFFAFDFVHHADLSIIWFFSYAVHLEFHIARDTVLDPATGTLGLGLARTKWIVIRSLRDDIAKCFAGGYNTIRVLAGLFAQLRLLQTVYLEAQELDSLDSGAGLYATLGREQVVQRTFKDAHRYAVEVRGQGLASGEPWQPLSPVWCLETYEEFRREWLPRAYWTKLTLAERRGWDPATPPEPTCVPS